jgi:hypothetical protein
MKLPFKKISVALIAILAASIFAAPAQAVNDIAISRTAFGAGVASNVGITLTGFDENQNYQATVKFVDTATNIDATNGTLSATQNGTSLVPTYTSYSGTKLGFKGTYAQVAAALASVTWNPSSASGDISIRIGIVPDPGTGNFYDANSGRYYKYVSDSVSWTAARTAAEATYLNGLRGYLAEINSAAENNFIANETTATNIWIGATEDASTASSWTSSSYNGSDGQKWIWAGATQTPLPTGSGTLAQSGSAPFSSWANNEPNNDSQPGQDCAVTNWSGAKGMWNDLQCGYLTGYLIEFGGRSGETLSVAAKTLTQTVVAKEAVTLGSFQSNISCTFGGNCQFPLDLTNPTAKNSSNVDVPGTYTYTSSNTASTTVTPSGSGATVTLVGAGLSTITATFTPTNTTLYAGNTKSFTINVTATAPSAPTGLVATASNGSVGLSWSAGSNGGSAITDYLVEYSADGSTWSTFADGTSSNTSATVTGLTNGTAYSFRVSAINSVNTGVASSVVSATPNVPPTPTGLTATPGNASVTLSWTAGTYGGPEVTDYVIQYSTDESTWLTFTDGTSAATSATVSGLTNGTTYFFRVSAANSLGTSTASSTVSTIPVAPPAQVSAPAQTATPTPTPSRRATPAPAASPQQTSQIESGTATRPAPLVARVVEELVEALKPVVVNVLAAPPANAPVLDVDTALNLVTSTANKVIGSTPSLVLFDGQFQASRVVILDNTTAQIVAPNGGLLNLQAKKGDELISVSDSGRIQMAQSNLVEAQGDGLAPNTEFAVYLFSDPTLLGIGRTNDKGEFFVSFAIENEIPLGDHTLQVNGLLADGRTSSVSIPVSVIDEDVAAESVIAPGANNSEIEPLPATSNASFPVGYWQLIGLAALVAGFWWLLAGLRRKKRDERHLAKPRVT